MQFRVWLLNTENGLHSVYATELRAKSAAWDLRHKFNDLYISWTEVQ